MGVTLATVLSARGADVAVTFRSSRADADPVVTAVETNGRRAAAIHADVSDAISAETMIAEVDRTFGRLDVLINMASIYASVPFETMTVGFGHAVAVTPLHLATGYATLFNGGIFLRGEYEPNSPRIRVSPFPIPEMQSAFHRRVQ